MSDGSVPAGALGALLRLSSPSLPVGAFGYSQGLECAVDQGWVKDEADALAWIGESRALGPASFEAPLLAHLHRAWGRADVAAARACNALFLAGRECAEFRAETLQMGYSLRQLLRQEALAGRVDGALVEAVGQPAYPTLWSLAAVSFGVPLEPAVQAYLWSWTENQVLGAIKLVPLGQFAGQRLIAALGAGLPALAAAAAALPLDGLSNFAPGLALAGSLHETQYSRLFRS